ncbi:hypothetical protein BKA70DRAFT_1441767 [Coprinopsis sp. MPI-PUGE-AT-0042]|nr:hypothetical protein BKA70DRAFT_1441767 [Coprinopsis sp. MPI-PUGE-AT-0042]
MSTSASEEPVDVQPSNAIAPLPGPLTSSLNQIINARIKASKTKEGGTWSCVVEARKVHDQETARGNQVPRLTRRDPRLMTFTPSDDFPTMDLKALLRDGFIQEADAAKHLPPGTVVGPGTLCHLPQSVRDEQERIRRLHRGMAQRFVEDSVGRAVATVVTSVTAWFSSFGGNSSATSSPASFQADLSRPNDTNAYEGNKTKYALNLVDLLDKSGTSTLIWHLQVLRPAVYSNPTPSTYPNTSLLPHPQPGVNLPSLHSCNSYLQSDQYFRAVAPLLSPWVPRRSDQKLKEEDLARDAELVHAEFGMVVYPFASAFTVCIDHNWRLVSSFAKNQPAINPPSLPTASTGEASRLPPLPSPILRPDRCVNIRSE